MCPSRTVSQDCFLFFAEALVREALSQMMRGLSLTQQLRQVLVLTQASEYLSAPSLGLAVFMWQNFEKMSPQRMHVKKPEKHCA